MTQHRLVSRMLGIIFDHVERMASKSNWPARMRLRFSYARKRQKHATILLLNICLAIENRNAWVFFSEATEPNHSCMIMLKYDGRRNEIVNDWFDSFVKSSCSQKVPKLQKIVVFVLISGFVYDFERKWYTLSFFPSFPNLIRNIWISFLELDLSAANHRVLSASGDLWNL